MRPLRRSGMVVGLVSATCLALMSSPASAAADYSSFFWQRELTGAGWAACEEAMTWSADTRGLTARQARREIKRLGEAWSAWSVASGVPVRFAGRERLRFDPGTNGLRRPDGAPQPDRHVYIAFKTSRQVPLMTRGVVGMAMPSIVMIPSREIVAGVAVFRLGYVIEQRRINPDRVAHLYLHEIGHVMGLGHARSRINVMYPGLDHVTRLGEGDRLGARAFTQPCLRSAQRMTASLTDSWE